MRTTPVPVPWWAIVVAPVNVTLFVAAAVIARIVHGPGYDPLNQTFSSLAASPRGGWVMTLGFVVAAAGYMLTGAGLRTLSPTARGLLIVAGLCGLAVAATREEPSSPLTVHNAAVAVGGLALVIWPIAAATRDGSAPLPRRVPTAMAVSAVLAAVTLWLLVAANTGGPVGLAERVAVIAQMAWPAVVALSVWSVTRRGPQVGDRHPDLTEQCAGERQRDADDRGRITVDALDEPAAEPVEGERTGDSQRLAGGQIGLQFGR